VDRLIDDTRRHPANRFILGATMGNAERDKIGPGVAERQRLVERLVRRAHQEGREALGMAALGLVVANRRRKDEGA
jgi:hypothetical protein